MLNQKKNDLKLLSKYVFNFYVEDPSNKDEKYLRTKVRSLKKPLEKSGIMYEQIFKSIQNLSFSTSFRLIFVIVDTSLVMVLQNVRLDLQYVAYPI